jgi:hypothetical protein
VRGTYGTFLLNEFFASRMADESRVWMYGGWKKSGAHTRQWMKRLKNLLIVHSLYQPIEM